MARSYNGIDIGNKKKNQLLVNNMDEKQNALRNQIKKFHSSDFIYIWFKTGKTNIFATYQNSIYLGECNHWESLTEIPPMLVIFYV